VKAGKLPKPAGASSDNAQGKVDALLSAIYAQLEADEINSKDEQGNIDPVPVAPRIVQKLCELWVDDTQDIAFKQVLLNTALTIAAASFTSTTNLPAPANYKECATPQTYWLNHKVGCAVASAGLFHQVLMPIRQALKIRDTGEI
jgi:hypothetical protein